MVELKYIGSENQKMAAFGHLVRGAKYSMSAGLAAELLGTGEWEPVNKKEERKDMSEIVRGSDKGKKINRGGEK